MIPLALMIFLQSVFTLRICRGLSHIILFVPYTRLSIQDLAFVAFDFLLCPLLFSCPADHMHKSTAHFHIQLSYGAQSPRAARILISNTCLLPTIQCRHQLPYPSCREPTYNIGARFQCPHMMTQGDGRCLMTRLRRWGDRRSR